jgi:hypothetical protein
MSVVVEFTATFWSPQQRTLPPVSRAQVCSSPAAISSTSVSPGTAIGVGLLFVVPSPS